MSATLSSRSAKQVPQLALRFGALPDAASNWRDGCLISYLNRDVIVRLGTHQHCAELNGDELHLPLPPEASARQVQDSAEAWLRQQCIEYVEHVIASLHEPQLVPTARRSIRVQLSFAARSPWLAVEDQQTLRCNWRLIELAPETIEQHTKKALGQLAALNDAKPTPDMFGALPV